MRIVRSGISNAGTSNGALTPVMGLILVATAGILSCAKRCFLLGEVKGARSCGRPRGGLDECKVIEEAVFQFVATAPNQTRLGKGTL